MEQVQYLVVLVTTRETLILTKKYDLPIKTVVRPSDKENFEVKDEAYAGDGIIINSEFFRWIRCAKSIRY